MFATFSSSVFRPLSPTRLAWVVIALTVLCSPSIASWSDDPAVNLAIADGAGEDVVPKIAGMPDGGCYVGWFDNSTGNYNVRLQRLAPDGTEQWSHNGIVVSAQPQESWITDWDLICDAQGNCVLTFSDIRSGNLDVQAYKITPAGDFAWGENGINLSQDAAWEPTPAVCQASDGDYVFAWGRFPDGASGMMVMQRLAPDGTPRLQVGGKPVVVVANESPGFPDLVPSLDGDVILMWVRDISSYMSPRHIRVQRFDPAGDPVWPTYTAIYDAAAVPMGYAPEIQADGIGGCVCGWHSAPVSMFSSYVQRISADGAEYYAHNGVLVSTDATRHHIDPATAFDPASGEFLVFWNERNSYQSEWGIYGQRISADGARLWGTSGLVIQPVNTVYKSYPRTAPLGDGAVCLFTDTDSDRLIAYRLDATGANVWAEVPVLVATTPSSKSRFPLFQDAGGVIRIIWEDTRNGTPDVYGQNLNPDGTLGMDPGAVQDLTVMSETSRICPNPFRGSTQIEIVSPMLRAGTIRIVALDGRIVREAAIGAPGAARATWRWDGLDGSGREVPAGVYAYRFIAGGRALASGKVVLVR